VLRRSLPIASVAAAAVALLPGTASAVPGGAPVDNTFSASYSANAELVLPDGRHASVWLGEHRGASQAGWRGQLNLTVWSEYTCWEIYTCQEGYASGYAELTDEQVTFGRSLATASATDVPITLGTSSWDPETGEFRTSQETVTVSVLFTATGAVERSASHGKVCGDGERECQSVRLYVNREATATVTLGDQAGVGGGSMSYAQGVDAAAPPFQYDY
jgi:hypothetical protein